jgi:type IV pilus assembly protein PilA
MKKNKVSLNKGFTLIEILVVIGIIAILAAIVIIAINPSKQFAQARNSQRTANVNAILNAVGQRMADNKGIFAGAFTIGSTAYTCGPITTTATNVTSTMAANTTTATADLGCLVPTYIPALPIDPAGPTTPTGYTIELLGYGGVKVCAPTAASETAVPSPAAICVTR